MILGPITLNACPAHRFARKNRQKISKLSPIALYLLRNLGEKRRKTDLKRIFEKIGFNEKLPLEIGLIRLCDLDLKKDKRYQRTFFSIIILEFMATNWPKILRNGVQLFLLKIGQVSALQCKKQSFSRILTFGIFGACQLRATIMQKIRPIGVIEISRNSKNLVHISKTLFVRNF